MKLIEKYYLVCYQTKNTPMHAISSSYFYEKREDFNDEHSRLLKQGFEDGYQKALKDLGITEMPKGERE